MSAIMNIDFGDNLIRILKKKGWSQAELARRTGRSRTAISDVISGQRAIGRDLALDIAEAFDMPPDEMFRLAGLLPPKPDADQTLDRIDYLYHSLHDPDNKKKALEYMEFLKMQDEKGDYDERKSPSPQPR